MKLYLAPNEWEERLLKLARHPADEIIISTYNLYAGVRDDGSVWTNKDFKGVQEFLDTLDKKWITEAHPTILVGIPGWKACCEWSTGPCGACVTKREKQLKTVNAHAAHWSMIDWFATKNWHLKAYLFKHGNIWKGLFGGVNLSASGWGDGLIDVMGPTAEKLAAMIKEQVNKSTVISLESLRELDNAKPSVDPTV